MISAYHELLEPQAPGVPDLRIAAFLEPCTRLPRSLTPSTRNGALVRGDSEIFP